MRHGSNINPPNRFEAVHSEADLEHLAWDEEPMRTLENRPIEYLMDAAQSIVSENTSPDIPFRYSVNPYRGCAHACPYCYARPTHEYLGMNAGLDFETKIVVKQDAPELFRTFLASDAWQPEPITFSGVTDCYQPAERRFQLTRRCLEVAWECRQPVSIVTKNALVIRDLDLLRRMAREQLVHVFLSVTTLRADLARDMEPRTSIPAARLRAVRTLAESGVAVGVMVAPIIAGLNDSELPGILKSAKEAGALSACYTLLRLPGPVAPVFADWLHRRQPEAAERVLGRVRGTRRGRMNQSTWGERMVGTGEMADQIRQVFQLFRQKHGLDRGLPPLDVTKFRTPAPRSGQLRLF